MVDNRTGPQQVKGFPADCYPLWHSTYAPLVRSPAEAVISSGCRVDSHGNIPCPPEEMRANAEQQLKKSALWPIGQPLSLDTYTLARYMQGEVGGGTVEERVAVGEAAVNRARNEGKSVLDILLFRQPAGHPNRGFYGPIHGPSGISTAPYGRWATTSADPTMLTLLLAQLITSGGSGNFSRGADDQDGPEYWIPQGQASLHGYVRRLASQGKYWVGPLPGVDHWHTFLQFTAPGSPDAAALLQRGLEALTLPAKRPVWASTMAVCPSDGTASATSATSSATSRTRLPGEPASPPSPVRSILIAVVGLGLLGLLAYSLSNAHSR